MATAERLFAEQGYHGTRLHQIAAAVGIQKASLFHHFAGKEDLHRAVLQHSALETGRTVETTLGQRGSFPERLRLLVSAYVDLVAAHPARMRMFLRQCLDGSPVSAAVEREFGPLLSLVVGFVEEGQQARAFRPLDATAFVLSVVGVAAFLLTSAAAVAPAWTTEVASRSSLGATVKHYLTELAERALLEGAEPAPAGRARPVAVSA